MAKRQIQEYPDLVIDPQQITGKLDWGEIFDNEAPVHIEIGSGKGTFLLNQAKACPDINFLGIEWANKYYRYAADRLGRWQITNARMIRTDADWLITECIPPGTIEMFHIYFPDPWPKKKHHKRRFFNLSNAQHLFACLAPEGIINIATDHADYFDQIRQVADTFIAQNLAVEIPFIRPAGAEEGEYVGTNYERKYMKEGRATHTLALQKT